MNDRARVFLAAPPARHAALLADLQDWVERRWLRELDRSFAAFLAQQAPTADPLLILAAALASHQLGRGHACLDLEAALADAGGVLALPPEEDGGAAETEGTAAAGTAIGAELGADLGTGTDIGAEPSAGVGAEPGTKGTEPGAADRLPASLASLLAGVDLPRWLAALNEPELVGAGPGATPLVLVGTRLYLRRYWQYEQSVREAIAQRIAMPTAAAAPHARAALAGALDALFPRRAGGGNGNDWQRIACALAARQGFGIITGGPGTGKTTTVVKLLAVLQHLALTGSGGAQRLRIRLAAPTGKAAARLNESIAGAVADLPLQALPNAQALRAAIPTEVTTVHRLLGSRPDTRRFRHDARNPLALDVLVLDEASMLDLEMMAAVFAALPAQARLILLGDKDQLASVEAGAVLGDLCQRADDGHYRPETADWLHAVAGERLDPALCDADGLPLDQAIVKLRVSHRFSADSGIGRLASAVNAGDDAAVRCVFADACADLSWQRRLDHAALQRLVIDGAPEGFPGAGQGRTVAGAALAPPQGYRHYLNVMRERQPPDDAGPEAFDEWARAVLQAYGQFQLLCAVRSGPQGVAELNGEVATLLREAGLLEAEQGGWYAGRPVLVTRNDYSLGLMNGDVGVTLALPQPQPRSHSYLPSHSQLEPHVQLQLQLQLHLPGQAQRTAIDRRARRLLRVAFPAGDGSGGIRWVLPSRLRDVDTVFAMTVHKSQGSEFTHAALLLPERPGAGLTRELVYTGITRARHWFTLVAGDEALRAAVSRRVERSGGLLAAAAAAHHAPADAAGRAR